MRCYKPAGQSSAQNDSIANKILFPVPRDREPYRYWLNQATAWRKACSLANFCFLSLKSARTAKLCDTPLNKLICHGWPALAKVTSDSWRSWMVKMWSISTLAENPRMSRWALLVVLFCWWGHRRERLTSSGDGEGTLDSAELFVGDEGRVGRVSDVDLAGLQKAADILDKRKVSEPSSYPKANLMAYNQTYLATKAVPNSTNLLNTKALTHIPDRLLHDSVHNVGLVVRQPGGEVALAGLRLGDLHLVAPEQIWDDGQVAAGGELVGEQLGVGRGAEDVG